MIGDWESNNASIALLDSVRAQGQRNVLGMEGQNVQGRTLEKARCSVLSRLRAMAEESICNAGPWIEKVWEPKYKTLCE